MQESPIDKRSLLLTLLFSLFIIAFIIAKHYGFDDYVVFCDVGEGDAAIIRLENGYDIVVDAGPDASSLECLGRYLPFWDKTIELAILSHPDLDHYGGFEFIKDRYRIDSLIVNESTGKDKRFSKLLDSLAASKTTKTRLSSFFQGDSIGIKPFRIVFCWPKTGQRVVNDNDYSSIFVFEKNGFKVGFTGDASPWALNSSFDDIGDNCQKSMEKVDILKVPHHGSKQGLTEKFLRLADPEVAVISVGKNNPYGHPSNVILDLLKAKKIKTLRTDEKGDIVFKIP